MKKQLIRLLGMAMLLLTFGTVSAQQVDQKRAKFEELDRNKDGMISKSELRQFRIRQMEEKGKIFSEEKFEKRFAKADQDGNGLLDESEIKRVRKFMKKRKGK